MLMHEIVYWSWILVSEMAHASKDHRQTRLVGSGDDLLIAH